MKTQTPEQWADEFSLNWFNEAKGGSDTPERAAAIAELARLKAAEAERDLLFDALNLHMRSTGITNEAMDRVEAFREVAKACELPVRGECARLAAGWNEAAKERDEAERLLRLACLSACGGDVGDKSLAYLREQTSPALADMAMGIACAFEELDRLNNDKFRHLQAAVPTGFRSRIRDRATQIGFRENVLTAAFRAVECST